MRKSRLLAFPLSVALIVIAFSCASGPKAIDRAALFASVVAAVPDESGFLTVDELRQAARSLKERYPDLVTLSQAGTSAGGYPILEVRIGSGKRHALLFGFPHPNEPIGSMMLRSLAEQLAANKDLRDYFDFTWHLVFCADPDKAKLNEGWFKGAPTVTKYARNYYRSPGYQQVEWTFPVQYKKYAYTTPIPEARALMSIIDANKIDFSFGLHNSDFGGVYYYWSQDVPEIYPPLYDFIAAQGLPLHLGEPEVPWGKKYDDRSMFKMLYFTDQYDYMEKYSSVPPEKILNSGASSDDYVKDKYPALTVNCELPYFYDPRIQDTRPSDMTRAEAMLASLAHEGQLFHSLRDRYLAVKPLLTARSPYVDTVEEMMRTGDNQIETAEKAIRAEKDYQRTATVAEKWDALSLRKFRRILYLGQFVRLLEDEKARTGDKFPAALQKALEAALKEFDVLAAEAEEELDYKIIPIKKLASVQLLTALYAMDHIQRH